MAVNKLNDPLSVRKRLPLSLPRPQVGESELEEIVKLGAQNQSLLTGGGQATAALIGM